MKRVAVTGARGMIGRNIIRQLQHHDCTIRALVRDGKALGDGIEVVAGDLASDGALEHLLDGVDVVFHCAAELSDKEKMHEVNAKGTERLAEFAAKKNVSCFIHISSAGVVGPVRQDWIDESTPCNPGSVYEMSKWQAEQALNQLLGSGVRLCVLRPVNAIDDGRPGVLGMAWRDSWKDRLALLIKGGELAHLVHAEDVAAAAVHLALSPLHPEGVFFVGCDEDDRNTVAGVLRMCREACGDGCGAESLYLPVSFPYWLRRMLGREALHGTSHFSSAKLLATGFVFPLGLGGALERVCSGWKKEDEEPFREAVAESDGSVVREGVCFVTGATSTIGRFIVSDLLKQGKKVRIISRKNISSWDEKLEVVQGDLREAGVISACLEDVDSVFHCAAEFHDQETLWDVNVNVTEHLVEAMRGKSISYFCYISSAGVLGACSDEWVDETTPCHPRDLYEKSKYAAEQYVMSSQLDARVCVLRPVFVVSPERPGFVQFAIRNSWKDRLMVHFKGKEQAHLIHASDIASAAVYFMDKEFDGPESFYVSCDEDKMNTVGGIYTCYRNMCEGKAWPESHDIPFGLPRFLPHMIRCLLRGPSLHGHVKFSSSKLKRFGFTLPLGLKGALQDIRSSQK